MKMHGSIQVVSLIFRHLVLVENALASQTILDEWLQQQPKQENMPFFLPMLNHTTDKM